MKKVVITTLVMIMGIGIVFADKPQVKPPPGKHYNLNIIGVKYPKKTDMNCGQGHRIFVDLQGQSKIELTQGDFEVIDCVATAGDSARFQLPDPCGAITYVVYARALGKPDGNAVMTSCIEDKVTHEEYCSVNEFKVHLKRDHGRPKWQNVTKELLYVHVDLDGGGVKAIPLFSDKLYEYFWDYDNNGLKLAQLRFYPVD